MKVQPLVTYLVKYTYPDYPNELETTVYCDFEPNGKLSVSELKERLETEVIGEEIDRLEIVDCISNTFSDDNLLSLMAVSILNGGYRKIGKIKLPDTYVQSLEFQDKKIVLDYIYFVYKNLNSEEKKEYKEKLINEIRTSLTCFPHQIDRASLNYILAIFGVNISDKDCVKLKLESFIDSKKTKARRQAILNKLTENEYTPKLRHSLDRIFYHYGIATESNQKRITALIYLIMLNYKKFKDSFQNNFSALMNNICDYWGIDTPTYRQGDAIGYRDSEIINRIKKRKLEARLKDNSFIECIKVLDEGIWNNLKY